MEVENGGTARPGDITGTVAVGTGISTKGAIPAASICGVKGPGTVPVLLPFCEGGTLFILGAELVLRPLTCTGTLLTGACAAVAWCSIPFCKLLLAAACGSGCELVRLV